MVGIAEKAKVIRCQHEYRGKRCNIPLCLQTSDAWIIKRHGREIQIELTETKHISIVCERCRNVTIVKKQ